VFAARLRTAFYSARAIAIAGSPLLPTRRNLGALFDAAMSGGAPARAEALRAVRDLSSVGTVVDVGGGQGRLLAGLLEAVPSPSGVLFDRPEVFVCLPGASVLRR
jgi:hypothetical protein